MKIIVAVNCYRYRAYHIRARLFNGIGRGSRLKNISDRSIIRSYGPIKTKISLRRFLTYELIRKSKKCIWVLTRVRLVSRNVSQSREK